MHRTTSVVNGIVEGDIQMVFYSIDLDDVPCVIHGFRRTQTAVDAHFHSKIRKSLCIALTDSGAVDQQAVGSVHIVPCCKGIIIFVICRKVVMDQQGDLQIRKILVSAEQAQDPLGGINELRMLFHRIFIATVIRSGDKSKGIIVRISGIAHADGKEMLRMVEQHALQGIDGLCVDRDPVSPQFPPGIVHDCLMASGFHCLQFFPGKV